MGWCHRGASPQDRPQRMTRWEKVPGTEARAVERSSTFTAGDAAGRKNDRQRAAGNEVEMEMGQGLAGDLERGTD